MHRSLILTVTILLILVLSNYFTSGQIIKFIDPTVEEAETEESLGPSPNASVNFIFANTGELKKAIAGDLTEILIGFINSGNKTFNITSVSASLNYLLDMRIYIQNFTEHEYDVLVHPNERITLSYSFTPDSLLDTRDFGFIASIFYNDDVSNYSTTFYNGSIGIEEADVSFDSQSFFGYTVVIAAVALIGFLVYRSYSTKKGRRAHREKIETGTTSNASSNEWLIGTAADTSNTHKRRAVKPVRKNR